MDIDAAQAAGTTNGTPAVSFENVTVRLETVTILDRVTAHAPLGSSTAIVGPNGAGKTTLLMAVLGQVPHTGVVHLARGRDGHAPRIGYVPQRLTFDRGLPMTVLEFLTMGLRRVPLWLGAGRRAKERARGLLAEVRATELEARRMGVLSGGELQRVLLALALERDPDLLVLDEPDAGVDFRGEQILCELLESLRAMRGFTQLLVSHDLAIVTAHATHVICLNRTVCGEGPPSEALRPDVLEATFGIHRGLPHPHGLPQVSGGHGADCDCEEEKQGKA
jgi:zinc transport system ATP-binding protein